MDLDLLGALAFLAVLVAMFGGMIIGARRFARRRRREGRWNERGPIDSSLPPTDFLQVYPRPWGIQRPSIESADEENPFKDAIDKDHES